MIDIKAIARRIAESMTESQRIDLIASLYEIYIRAIQPIDYTKQQCVPSPDWMHEQCSTSPKHTNNHDHFRPGKDNS